MTSMRQLQRRDPATVLRDGPALDRAMARAHRRVVLKHRQLNMPIVIWRDGRVVEVPPESIDLPLDDEETERR